MCDLILDRDHNAAINILKKGLKIFNVELPQELREVTPVKILKGSMKQERLLDMSDRGSQLLRGVFTLESPKIISSLQ
jgi:hypothetical protein